MLGQALFEKEALRVELALLTRKLVELKKVLKQEWRQKAVAQQALREEKMLGAKRSIEAGVAVASARKEAVKQVVKEIEQWCKAVETKRNEVLKEKSIRQAISFGIHFQRSTFCQIKQKHLGSTCQVSTSSQ